MATGLRKLELAFSEGQQIFGYPAVIYIAKCTEIAKFAMRKMFN